MGCVGRHATALGWRDDPEPAVDAPDDEVVVVDLDGLAGLDDAPAAARAERREQRRPRPEVGPADVHRGHHDLAARAAPSMTA